MSSPSHSHKAFPVAPTPATSDRVQRDFGLRTQTAARDAFVPAPTQYTNGDEQRYADKCGTYSKGIKQSSVGLVDLAAFQSFRQALDSGDPTDFEEMIVGGTKTQNGPQGGLAFALACLENSQFLSPPAPALASEQYATELVELYWASLLRDVAFTDYSTNAIASQAAAELSAMPSYAGPRVGTAVTTDVLFRGGYPGETVGPYVSQFLLQNTSLGALPVTQQYTTAAPGIDFMKDPTTFLEVQNGIATGLSITPAAPAYLHDGRGFSAYTHVDVLYQAYFTAYLVLTSLNASVNPGNPYANSKTQNGFGTFGSPDFVTSLATAACEALRAVWYQKWFVHLRHRPEAGGGLVYLANTPSATQALGKLSPTVLNSRAVAQNNAANNSFFLSQAFPEGSPIHPAYPTGHGAVAGACITVLKFFFDGNYIFPNPVAPSNDGTTTSPISASLNVNGELNKLAHNISFGHGIHAGIHWRSDTDASIQLGEAVALSFLQDRAQSYNEKFTVNLQKVDGTIATISNQ